MRLFGANYARRGGLFDSSRAIAAGQPFGRDFCVRRWDVDNIGRSQMSGRNEQEYLFQEAARRELGARPHRQARIPDAQPGHRPWLGRRRRRGEVRRHAGVRSGPTADADLLSVDSGPASRHPDGQREVPRDQLPDRAGRGLRHRALRRRGEEQARAPGTSMSGRRRSSRCRRSSRPTSSSRGTTTSRRT